MPFGYSRKLFDHPAIEYIPLLPLETHEITEDLPTDAAQLFLVSGNEKLDSTPFATQLIDFSLQPVSEMGLIIVNSQLECIKYRGNYVTIVVQPTKGLHQAHKILTRYFYKKDLIFQVVNTEGKVLAQRPLTVPIKR